MTEQPQPLSPTVVALSPERRLALAYAVPADLLVAHPDQLREYLLYAINSAVWAMTTGQAHEWARGARYAGYEVVFEAPVGEPSHVTKLLGELPREIAGEDVVVRWSRAVEGDPQERLDGLEQAVAGLLQPIAARTGHPILMWATHVGDHRLAGLQEFTSSEFDNEPYDGPVPEGLDEAVSAHKLLYYDRHGRAWLALTLRVQPDGSYAFHGDTESIHPWARPVPDAAWELEKEMFPARTHRDG